MQSHNDTLRQKYTSQLREDALSVLLPTIVFATIFANMVAVFIPGALAEITDELAILNVLISAMTGRVGWLVAKRGHISWGSTIFLGGQLFIIGASFQQVMVANSALLYLAGIIIVLGSTLIHRAAAFYLWGFTTTAVILMAMIGGPADNLVELWPFLIPMLVNLSLTVVVYIITSEWLLTTLSLSEMQVKAEQRSRDLFAAQEALRQANAQQEFLYTHLTTSVAVGQRATTLLDIDTLLSEVANLVKDRLQFAYTAVFLPQDDGRLIVRAQASDRPLVAPIPLTDADDHVIGRVARRQQAVVVEDIRAAGRHPYQLETSRSEAGLPLMVGDRLLGIINIQSYRSGTFTAQVLPILRLMADQVAIAIDNARLYEQATDARSDAERANQLKTHFLASMSHELRTPLNAVINFTGFVMDGVFGEVNEEQEDALRKATESGELLLSLINDVLDLAKIEAGMMDIFIQEVDMNGVVESVATAAKGLLKNKPVSLILNVEDELPTLVGDKRRLRQTLLNLVSNAVKFTPHGSITMTAESRPDHLYLAVTDTGIGISEENQNQIFESFRQLKHELDYVAGTGLGLPICKHFVEMHGGRLWVESAENEGSVFHMTVPYDATIYLEAASMKEPA